MSSEELTATIPRAEIPSVAAPSPEPSAWRAWRALVWLSLQRQARARQMVWIAVALLVFAVTLVAINTAAGRWGMSKWRMPRRVGPTFPVWVDQSQMILGMAHSSPGAHGLQHAVLGSVNAIITPG